MKAPRRKERRHAGPHDSHDWPVSAGSEGLDQDTPMKTHLLFPLVGLSLVAGAVQPAVAKSAEASIPFVNHGGIDDWQAIDRRTLYIRDAQHHWYRATLMGDCLDLDYATRIGFAPGAGDRLDRFSNILVHGHRCPIASLVASGPPPSKAKTRAEKR